MIQNEIKDIELKLEEIGTVNYLAKSEIIERGSVHIVS